jgi:hypothetical protein
MATIPKDQTLNDIMTSRRITAVYNDHDDHIDSLSYNINPDFTDRPYPDYVKPPVRLVTGNELAARL